MKHPTGSVILKNAIRTPDGTLLESKHRHDMVMHTQENGKVYGVDGGLDYLRRIGFTDDVVDKSIVWNVDEPFSVVRENLQWGTHGKTGREPLKYIALCEMETSHIAAVLIESKLSGFYRAAMMMELVLRNT